jgi:hypothetical protein
MDIDQRILIALVRLFSLTSKQPYKEALKEARSLSSTSHPFFEFFLAPNSSPANWQGNQRSESQLKRSEFN